MRYLFKRKFIIFVISFILFANQAFADLKADIYSKLDCCPCNKAFEECECLKGKEMKAYIEAFLDAGLDEEEILIKVARKYSLNVIIDEEAKKEIEKKLIEEAPDKRPEILIQPLSYNAGKVSKSKGKWESVIEIYNKGNAAITINDLKTSCGCTTVKLKTKEGFSPAFSSKGAESGWKTDIASGEKAELIIVTHLDHPSTKLGPILRVVKIKSNDPVYSLIELKLEAEIVD